MTHMKTSTNTFQKSEFTSDEIVGECGTYGGEEMDTKGLDGET
jgi:hypothetical protein